MTDKNKEDLKKPKEQMTDVELSKRLSPAVYKYYHKALETIEIDPETSLFKFRKALECVIEIIANEFCIKLKNKKLFKDIESLFDDKTISKFLKKVTNKSLNKVTIKSLENNIHETRDLCNDGVHNGSSFKNKDEFDEKINRLAENALVVRKTIKKIFVDVYLIKNNDYPPLPIDDVPLGHSREIIYNALISTSYEEKLKAGIVCESMFKAQFYSSNMFVSNDVMYHFDELKNITLAFYEAAYKISAQMDDEQSSSNEEEIIFKKCKLEILYKYADFGLLCVDRKNEKFKKALQAAADREHIPAKALLGAIFYEEKEYNLALEYLTSVKDECQALLYLYYYYANGDACTPDIDKALKYLNRAVELNYPDALATLGELYYEGKYLTKNEIKAKELLEESIALGSERGKNTLSGYKEVEKYVEFLKNTFDDSKPKPIVGGEKIGRNEKCPCGSGKKYKNCHGNPNKKTQQEFYL
jgi:hypothetical protein